MGFLCALFWRLYGLVCNCGVGPDAFSDRGCLRLQVDLLTEDLPGQDCCEKCNECSKRDHILCPRCSLFRLRSELHLNIRQMICFLDGVLNNGQLFR